VSVAQWVVVALLGALAVAAYFAVVRRSPYLRLFWGTLALTLLLGGILALGAVAAERLLERWAEIDPATGTGGAVTLLVYAFVVRAPFEMALAVAAVAPFWRWRRTRLRGGLSRDSETAEGVALGAAAGLGFGAGRAILALVDHGAGWLDVARAAVGIVTFALLCAMWGFALGRDARRGLGSARFRAAWLTAALFAGVTGELLQHRGVAAFLAVLPLVGSMLVVGWMLWRAARSPAETRTSSGKRPSFFGAPPTPSLTALREAFRQQDRPRALRWVGFGALVTMGMIATGFAGAVLLGRKLGVDFSAVDRPDAGVNVMAPLALLGGGVLLAFPLAGYVLARASGARSVLEPALAGALSMALLMVVMGMVAPVSIVFAIAFAPVAFALSCAGAWVGLASS
jgi:hypothetical protein